MGQANIQIGDWRFYTDASPDTSMVPLAGENTKPTFTQSQIENGIIRLRCQLLNIGDKDDLADVEVQYSVDNTNWNTISNQAGGSADQWIWWADGAATHGNTITNLLLGDSDTYGLYHENTGLDEDVDQNTKVEFDCALYIQWPPPSTTVRLRILYDGVAEEYEDGVPQIQFDTPSPANRSHTIDKLDWPTYDTSTVEIRGAMRPNTWYDGDNWWTFVVDANSLTDLLYYYWSGSGNWSSAQTRSFTDTAQKRGNDVRCKVINGYKVVMVYWNHNQSGNRYVRRGTISGTTITWGDEVDSGVSWRGERIAVGIDDGNYWWAGGIYSATGVWAIRATNADAGSSWTTGFNSERSASDTGVATDDQCAIIGLASNKMLMIWRSGDALKWALCTDPSGFGSVNTLVSTANPVDWGVARAGGYVYLVHTDSTSEGGNWVLRVFDETGEGWSLGTSPSVSGQPSTGDGILVQADGDDLYAWGTFTGTGGNPHRSVEGKKYAGPGASGTWDGSRTIITPEISRGNGDHINGAVEIANGKALVLFEFGDANLDGQNWSLEYHYETVAAPPVTVDMAVVNLTSAPQAGTLTPGPVSLAMAVHDLTGSAETLTAYITNIITMAVVDLLGSAETGTVVPGAVTIPINVAGLTSAGETLTLVPGAVSVPMNVADLGSVAQGTTLVPGAVSITISVADLGSVAQAATIVPGPVSIAISVVNLTGSPQTATLVPGAVSIPINVADLTASAQTLSVFVGVVVSCGIVDLTSSPQAATLVPGAVSIGISVAGLTATAQTLSVSIGELIAMAVADLTAEPQTAALIPGAVSVLTSVADLGSVAHALTLVPGPVSLSISVADLTAQPQPLTLLPGPVSISATVADLTATASTLSVVIGNIIAMGLVNLGAVAHAGTLFPGPVSIPAGVVDLSSSVQPLTLVPGAVTIPISSVDLSSVAESGILLPGPVQIAAATADLMTTAEAGVLVPGPVSVLMGSLLVTASGEVIGVTSVGIITPTRRVFTVPRGARVFVVPKRSKKYTVD